ncbi:ankyrin [Choiromyces venosus 120613-1]|uniref:Ankyrin n=1 Tax=Choiromyces venosus 120613-1 TaxID=1336337 RepID=A0A3N4J8B2_9PEZI|nr:ankyrin [Choiromyces venosus 120613-1]
MNYVPVNRDRLNSQTLRTLLSWAAKNGHTEVVKLLMGPEDVELDASDFRARTPLFFAVLNGYEGVVRLLLSRHDINLNSLDNSRETHLGMAGFSATYLATWCEHEKILGIPPAREDADPNLQNWNGWGPLSLAVGPGKTSMAKMLLERADVDPDPVESDGWTPLDRARANGYKDIVVLIQSQISMMGQ